MPEGFFLPVIAWDSKGSDVRLLNGTWNPDCFKQLRWWDVNRVVLFQSSVALISNRMKPRVSHGYYFIR